MILETKQKSVVECLFYVLIGCAVHDMDFHKSEAIITRNIIDHFKTDDDSFNAGKMIRDIVEHVEYNDLRHQVKASIDYLNDHLGREQKINILILLTLVILADNIVHLREKEYIVHVCERWGIDEFANEIISKIDHINAGTANKQLTEVYNNITEILKVEVGAAEVAPSPNDEVIVSILENPPNGIGKTATIQSGNAGITASNNINKDVAFACNVKAEHWFAISRWAKENNQFENWERSLLYSLGLCIKQQRNPSEKQARQAVRLYKSAIEKGCDPAKVAKPLWTSRSLRN